MRMMVVMIIVEIKNNNSSNNSNTISNNDSMGSYICNVLWVGLTSVPVSDKMLSRNTKTRSHVSMGGSSTVLSQGRNRVVPTLQRTWSLKLLGNPTDSESKRTKELPRTE